MPADHASVIGYVPASDKKLAGRPILDVTKIPPPLVARVPGIDVSFYQGSVDWEKVAAASVEFVFIKATEGRRKPDSLFTDHWDRAQQAGLYTSAYHFMRSTTGGADQAKRFLAAAGSRYQTARALPPVLDLEATGLKEKEILTWLETVDAALGFTPLVYLNFDFASRYAFSRTTVGAYPLWFAQYPLRFRDNGSPSQPLHISEQKTWRDWAFWQYSETGKVPGIASGYVDLDVFRGSLVELEAWRSRMKHATP